MYKTILGVRMLNCEKVHRRRLRETDVFSENSGRILNAPPLHTGDVANKVNTLHSVDGVALQDFSY
jgi:hypothetical protein